jgi:alpha-methylacyl-CoA racemase
VRVLEFAGIGPAPFCGMLLADMGADVLRLDRLGEVEMGSPVPTHFDVLGRGKRSLGLDLKNPLHADHARALIARADVLLEGFRPGVMEKLGLGPEPCLAANNRLVYARMTGWGQSGPLAQAAAHDINYVSLTGALHAIGPRERPVPPLTLAGDFGGGGMFMAVGVLAALHEAKASGRGQVVDAAICDGAALLMAPYFARHAAGLWHDERAANGLDGGAPWYDCYETADGQFISIGAIEGRFWDLLLGKLGLTASDVPDRRRKENWPALRDLLADTFRRHPRAHWETLLGGTDACFAPVLSLAEAPRHAHLHARGVFDQSQGYAQPAPAPRFSRWPHQGTQAPPERGAGGAQALMDWGLDPLDVQRMADDGIHQRFAMETR